MTQKKKKYLDRPRFPVINDYENDFRKSWKLSMKIALKEIENKIK